MDVEAGRLPAGTGLLAGFATRAVAGVIVWLAFDDVTSGLIVYVAGGPGAGIAFEQSLDTRPLSARGRRIATALAVLGTLVGVVVPVYVVWLA